MEVTLAVYSPPLILLSPSVSPWHQTINWRLMMYPFSISHLLAAWYRAMASCKNPPPGSHWLMEVPPMEQDTPTTGLPTA
ncbi:hypothetical protein D3C81_2247430 [compost metagenome]